jgi:hypothetical protein
VDHRSFRNQLVFSIGFAVTRSRALLRRILKEHAPDDARQQLAERVVQHLELSGFEIDEDAQVMKKRPPTSGHGKLALRLHGRHLLEFRKLSRTVGWRPQLQPIIDIPRQLS